MDKLLRVPSLQALQALLHVADASSFTAAARQLHLTQSAISRQVQQLEEYYRVPLFDRTSRKVVLTDAGREVYGVARDMLKALLRLEERLAPVPLERPFRIRIFVSLAVRWLLPRLSSFYAANPGLCLSIESVGGEVAACMLQRDVVREAAVVVLLAGFFDRVTFKYGDRGYRFTLLEAGHVAQNLNLAAGACGWGALNLGGCYDREVDDLIGLDGVSASAVYAVALGFPQEDATAPGAVR